MVSKKLIKTQRDCECPELVDIFIKLSNIEVGKQREKAKANEQVLALPYGHRIRTSASVNIHHLDGNLFAFYSQLSFNKS